MGVYMDTLRSPTPQGPMEGLAGTGRSPQIHSALRSLLSRGERPETNGSTLFSEEVERAEERAELGSANERMAVRADEHREKRHGTFGQERTPAEGKGQGDRLEGRSEVPSGTARPVETPKQGDRNTAAGQPSTGDQVASGSKQSTTEGNPAAGKGQGDAQSSPNTNTGQVASAPTAGSSNTPAGTPTPATTGAVAGVKAVAASTALPDALATRGDSTTTKAPKSTPQAEPQPSTKETAEAAEILRQIKVATTSGVRSMTVELAPLALGRVQIRVSLRGKSMNAVIEADNPETFAALEKQAPELRALLSEATGGRDVNLTLLGGETQGQGPGERSLDSSGNRAENRSTTTGVEAARNEQDESTDPARTPVSLNEGAIDTYA
ncbi:MAG: hypothetical protein ACI8QS_003679 [Planctomycetota bacterium]|jgi:hypothetical protein